MTWLVRSLRSRAVRVLGLGGVLAFACAGGSAPGRPNSDPAPCLEESLQKARVQGKYEMLLRQIQVRKDYRTYRDFHDAGFRETSDYAGYGELPKGYWVYVYPYWYIWRDRTAVPKTKRGWGPEQATGEPDTHQAGDVETAWASLTADGEDEWLLLEYAEPVVPTAVLVYESFNPGALTKVSVFKLDGSEFTAWSGKDPTPVGGERGVSEIPIKVPFKTNRVKIYLASKAVPGWNEIDAVGLRDKADKVHWASAAEASSTYARGAYTAVTAEDFERQLDRLEAEVGKLREANAKLAEENRRLREQVRKQK